MEWLDGGFLVPVFFKKTGKKRPAPGSSTGKVKAKQNRIIKPREALRDIYANRYFPISERVMLGVEPSVEIFDRDGLGIEGPPDGEKGLGRFLSVADGLVVIRVALEPLNMLRYNATYVDFLKHRAGSYETWDLPVRFTPYSRKCFKALYLLWDDRVCVRDRLFKIYIDAFKECKVFLRRARRDGRLSSPKE